MSSVETTELIHQQGGEIREYRETFVGFDLFMLFVEEQTNPWCCWKYYQIICQGPKSHFYVQLKNKGLFIVILFCSVFLKLSDMQRLGMFLVILTLAMVTFFWS